MLIWLTTDYDIGYRARLEGKPSGTNPHSRWRFLRRMCWNDGWETARRDQIKASLYPKPKGD